MLLDTHAFLWWVEDAPALSKRARAAIANPEHGVVVSLASCWELAVKVSIGKIRLKTSIERFLPEQLAANGFELFNLELRHVLRVATLPFHHRDPFDRLLAAQALEEDVSIVSGDRVFKKYGVSRIW